MGDKTLSDCVEDDFSNGYIFESKYPIAADRLPKHYEVYRKVGNDLRVFPVDYVDGEPVARKKSVGLLYQQQKDDLVFSSF